MKTVNEEKLAEMYNYIRSYQKENGSTPSYREIQDACRPISLGTVAANVVRLKERGMIETNNSVGAYRRNIAVPFRLRTGKTHRAPIVGECPCGEPMLAEENIEATVALPEEIFGKAEHFLLHAKGYSMINRGIFDGDLMVVRIQNTAEIGEVVIARVNGGEATAKLLAEKDGKIYLRPANDEINAQGKRKYRDIYPEGEWEILGVVDNVIHSPRNIGIQE